MSNRWVKKGILKLNTKKTKVKGSGFVSQGEVIPDTIPKDRQDEFIEKGWAMSEAEYQKSLNSPEARALAAEVASQVASQSKAVKKKAKK